MANRGEIAIRVFRACHELGIRTVAIYSEEDKNTLFRSKADEAYQVGKGKTPVGAYLGIEEIIALAKAKGVDAIHPGYGFLAENVDFARACRDAGIVFIGPTPEMMEQMGDKVKAKLVARAAGVPIIPGVEKVIRSEEEALRAAARCGYPVMLKAAAGGGGRGMRIVQSEKELLPQFRSARSEAAKAFGIDDIFIEKYLEEPKHIEVQILGDQEGNLLHLYERDCSIQRRHQKVIEFTPALCLDEQQRQAICADALKIARAVNYQSAGTVEFLVDKQGKHYFIEMNPRIQVEHTVTEMVTGVDIVQTQILIAQGYTLDSDRIRLTRQYMIPRTGYAIQCRVTTENPANDFMPDTGVIETYRSPGGAGIRIDGGNGFQGAEITPFYDSLLIKIIAYGRTFEDTRRKAMRALQETRIQGVETNIPFMLNVLNHRDFAEGKCDTGFLGRNPGLVKIDRTEDQEKKVMAFLGEKYVNGNHGNKPHFNVPVFPRFSKEEQKDLTGTRQMLREMGTEKFVKWIREESRLLLTDTTMRDAQQSLMATRVRTVDMEKIAPAVAVYGQNLFSLEMWGGATFDTAYRFLGESPWERLDVLREKIPNILFQMLLRGANAVGYKNYPDNVIREFVRLSARSGIDVFRIFDSLNWIPGMEVALDEVLNQGKLAEACICYTGDILDQTREKYNLNYYIRMAKELERRGTHILGIKDMSGLLKPMAAEKLIRALKEEIGIPIHLHTHDTCGTGLATVLMAAQAGVDIVDAAFNSMSGLTSQPGLNSIAAALENSGRDTGLPAGGLQKISNYWQDVRPVYAGFESELLTSTAEIYRYEIPGGQYSNLKPQVESFGLGHRFEEVKKMYRTVNKMLGDIVKVTPTSKAVGDLAIFMVQNGLTPENIYEKAAGLDFPDSVVSYFEGMMGQPEGGFPKELQKLVLKGRKPITIRPGELLEPEDLSEIRRKLMVDLGLAGTAREVISYALYPKVFEEYQRDQKEKGNFRYMGSDIFFHGLEEGETCEVKLGEGNFLMVKLCEVRPADSEGYREAIFEIDGNRRSIRIRDTDITVNAHNAVLYADPENPAEIGAQIPGNIVKVFVQEGETVKAGQPVALIEAMKMETNILSQTEGVIERIYVSEGDQVKAGQMVIKLNN